jgi:hypothetical protein
MGQLSKVPLDCGIVVDANQTVLFVDGTADVFPVSKKIDLFDAAVKRPHADGSPMSVCLPLRVVVASGVAGSE